MPSRLPGFGLIRHPVRLRLHSFTSDRDIIIIRILLSENVTFSLIHIDDGSTPIPLLQYLPLVHISCLAIIGRTLDWVVCSSESCLIINHFS